MATQCSFDITSNVDLQEVDNALNQAKKEVAQRYDFKGSKASIDFDAKESKLVLTADDEFKLNALWEIVQTRLIRRNVPVRNLTRGTATPAANSTVRQEITLRHLPAGTWDVNGASAWTKGARSWSLAVETVTPLHFDPACEFRPRFPGSKAWATERTSESSRAAFDSAVGGRGRPGYSLYG